jgi:hypothetical protein
VPRRILTIKARFEPTRMGGDPLQVAYQVVAPEQRILAREDPKLASPTPATSPSKKSITG